MQRILMVCLGNICRSPVAEGIMRDKIKKYGIKARVDSAGTADFHVGESPDSRSYENALEKGIDISSLRARQFKREDFDAFDRIYVMDKSNYTNVTAMSRTMDDTAKVKLILDEIPGIKGKSVPDPYFGGAKGFDTVFNLLNDACEVIATDIKKQESEQ
jgi:protein-tyrosine phosphatase